MLVRVSTLQQSNLVTGFALKTQERIYRSQLEVASGQKSQNYGGLSPRSNQLINVENRLTRAEQYLENIQTAQLRIKLMESSLSEIDDLAREFRSNLNLSVNGDAAFTTQIWTQASNLMIQLEELLNQKDAGRYLFGGNRGDARPVDTAAANFAAAVPAGNIPPPHPNTGLVDATLATYYQGSTEAAELAVKVDDSTNVTYGVKANERAIQELLTAVHIVRDTVIAATPVTAADRNRLNEALTRVNYALEGADPDGGGPLTAIDSISQITARITGANVTLEQIKVKHERFQIYAADVIGNIENADPAEAVARLNADQIALQASFEALSRLQDVSLVNFLR
ncbi:MAG: flagellin [Alphaproteobacteria bacterium]|nr:flagellin [Alphaproteobacteria bacterium]